MSTSCPTNLLIDYLPGTVIGACLILSEILSFVPRQYIQSNGIVQLVYNIFTAWTKSITPQPTVTAAPLANTAIIVEKNMNSEAV